MSRNGNCYDNAPMESSFNSFKVEDVYHEKYEAHEQAVRTATSSNELWNVKGTGWKTTISMWSIMPKGSQGEGFVSLSSGSFVAHQSYINPSRHRELYALRMPLPKPIDIKRAVTLPKLTNFRNPPSNTGWIEASVVRLPWFAVKDERRTEAQRFQDSPLYEMRRKDRYTLIPYIPRNDTKELSPATVTYNEGDSSTAARSFSQTTGLSLSAGYIPPGNIGGVNVSVTLSHSWTQSWSISKTISRSTEKSHTPSARPGETAALYQVESKCSSFRMDGEQVQEFDVKSSQIYPTSFGG